MTKLFGRAISVAALCAAALTGCIMPGLRMPSDTLPQAQFLKTAPRRSVYSQGDSFDPAAGLAVYRTTAEGTWETVPSSLWTSVTITPKGGTPEDAAGFTFTSLEGHTVEVKALGMDAACDLWVLEAGNRPAIAIVYTSGAGGRMEQNAGGEWEVAPAYTKRNEMIYSFTTVDYRGGGPGRTYYMGRPDDRPIKLNIDEDGTLDFRLDRVNNNFIPVGTVAEMQMINTVPGALAGNYCQEADIDLLGGVTGPPLTPLTKYTWKPIGKAAPYFTGVFDGGGNSLDNIYVNEGTSAGAGLFGYINGNAVLQNIRLKNGSVTGGDDAGGIAGGQWDKDNQSIKILNCSNGAAVTSTGVSVAGIIGYPQNSAFIAGCRNSGDVSGNTLVGGIAGGGDLAMTIRSCYNTATVSGNNRVGGIIGTLGGSPSATACYNDGEVDCLSLPYNPSDPSKRIAGIQGDGHGVPSFCYWNADKSQSGTPGRKDGNGVPHGNADGTGDDDKTVAYTNSFPDVSAVPGWETSVDGSAGYWKPGTTTGGQLPQLWWE